MQSLRTSILIPVVAGSCVAAFAMPAAANIPTRALPVGVAQGRAQLIDLALHPAGEIAGRVFVHTPPHRVQNQVVRTAPVVGATVRAYAGRKVIDSAVTDATGEYALKGLRARTSGYRVCALATTATNLPLPTGELSGCWVHGGWNGVGAPKTGRPVKVKPGRTSAVNIALARSAAIAGTVIDANKATIAGVQVVGENRTTHAVFHATTNAAGRYVLTGITASSAGYTVCARTKVVGAGTGYRATCYGGVWWQNQDIFPSTSTKVSVTVPKPTIAIRIAMPAGGEVTGTVTDASTSAGIAGESVEVFTGTGFSLGEAVTDASGSYSVIGLPRGTGERACVTPYRDLSTGTTYPGQCWNAVDWQGGPLPGGTTALDVGVGTSQTGINFALTGQTTELATISGTIVAQSDNKHLYKAEVDLFSAGKEIKETHTDRAGGYEFAHVMPNQPYAVCAKGVGAHLVGVKKAQPFSWAPQCDRLVAWGGAGPIPSSATQITPTPGASIGVNFALRTGGAISGRTRWLKQAGTSTTPAIYVQIPGVTVYLYDRAGNEIAKTQSVSMPITDAFGRVIGSTGIRYRFTGLATGTPYIICYDGSTSRSKRTFLAGCYKNVGWAGPE